jgi:high affinity Mn2+ porin
LFLRAGWNDGHNETWVFTEIDRHLSCGVIFNGKSWHRGDDNIGVAQIINGLSGDHRNYLKAGGYGFIIGDGHLNYRPELVTEVYYSFRLSKYPVWITPDYQLIVNPAYNKDRGPVHAFGIRVHTEI